MKRKAIIIGCGGHSRVIASILNQNNIEIFGFFDDAYDGIEEKIVYGTLQGKVNDVYEYSNKSYDLYLAVGDNQKRQNLYSQFKEKSFSMPPLVHPLALLDSENHIGSASQVCIGAKISIDAVINDSVIINSGSIVDHESKIGSFSHLAPGVIVAGRTHIGEKVFIGMGSKIADGITIGENSVIGAGSIVLKDVPSDTKVIGVYH